MNLIEKLQAEAIDDAVPLSTLLRKVKLIASKLKLGETIKWVDAELQGYGADAADYPEYRKIQGRVMAYSPYHGWRSPGGDGKLLDKLSNREIADSVSSLEDLLSRDKDGTLTLLISHEVKSKVLSGNHGWTDMHTEIQRTALVGILSHVRTLVLNWALELEEKGISGSGVTFSEEDTRRAQSSSVSIEHFYGNLHSGDISGVQNRVNQGANDSSSNSHCADAIFAEVENASQDLDGETRHAVETLIAELRASRDKPSRFIAAYTSFVSIAADHVALMPFIPALAALMPT